MSSNLNPESTYLYWNFFLRNVRYVWGHTQPHIELVTALLFMELQHEENLSTREVMGSNLNPESAYFYWNDFSETSDMYGGPPSLLLNW